VSSTFDEDIAMDISKLERRSENEWVITPDADPRARGMRVPGVIFATEALVRDMDEKVFEQVANVAKLPGIVAASYAMPDAHWGYGFPIGGVAAFDPDEGGVVSAGGVGFDISCGVRCLRTGLKSADVEACKTRLADALYARIPAGVGSTGAIRLSASEMDSMLAGGARWAVSRGYGVGEDLERIEEGGCMRGARPEAVSEHAKKRQRDEMGTLGSGNHYLEVQRVAAVFDEHIARVFGLAVDDVVVSIHCGSRGLGHQIGTEYLRTMAVEARQHGIELPDRELACAPLSSATGQNYLGAMRAAINCALANRQILTHLTRQVFADVLPAARLPLIYDVSHNTCKLEEHVVEGRRRALYVHRKGATRAFGPGHPDLPPALRDAGQPVLIGGSMGTCSYVLAGAAAREERAFSSACHGAGRSMSRHEATRRWHGRQVVDELAHRGVLIRSPSLRGVAEEAPGAYKDVTAVVDAAEAAGLARKVARLEPIICIKG
jgi:tRNA-splicing ligase RtcB